MSINLQNSTANVITNISNITLSNNNISLFNETINIVGNSSKGPAFVPTHITSFYKSETTLNTFENVFGLFDDQFIINKEHVSYTQSSISLKSWFDNQNSQACFTRILGIGNEDGLRDEFDNINGAGFIVGETPFSGSLNFPELGKNKFSNFDNNNDNIKGKTYFYCKKAKNLLQRPGPLFDFYQQHNIDFDNDVFFITNLIFSAPNTRLSLVNNSDVDINLLADPDFYRSYNESNITNDFITYTNEDIACITPFGLNNALSDNRFLVIDNLINKDLLSDYNINYLNYKNDLYLEHGHFCYSDYDSFAIYNENIFKENGRSVTCLLAESDNVNDNSEDYPNYEDFSESFQNSISPWIVSQPIIKGENDKSERKIEYIKNCIRLFRFKAIDDGEIGNRFRIRITPKRVGYINSDNEDLSWSNFSIRVFERQNDFRFKEVLYFDNVNLNKNSRNYICRLFGTIKYSYDFINKKVVFEGLYEQTNNYLIVEVNEEIEFSKIHKKCIPVGFEGYPTIDTSGIKNYIYNSENVQFHQLPLKYIGNLLRNERSIDAEDCYWGVNFNLIKYKNYEGFNLEHKIINDNKKLIDPAYFYSKFLQINKKIYKNFVKKFDYDNDIYNSFFSIEKIVLFKKANNEIDWNLSLYRRDGLEISELITKYEDFNITNEIEYLSIEDILVSTNETESINSRFLGFDLFTYGGFDGVNILDNYKRTLDRSAVINEINYNEDTPTFNSYKKGIEIALDTSNNDSDIFCCPSLDEINLIRYTLDLNYEKNNLINLFDVPTFEQEKYIDPDDGSLTYSESFYSTGTYTYADIFDNNQYNYRSEQGKNLSNAIQFTLNNHSQEKFISKNSAFFLNKGKMVIEDKISDIFPTAMFIGLLRPDGIGFKLNNTITDIINYEASNINNNYYSNIASNTDYNINLFYKNRTEGVVLNSSILSVDNRNIVNRYISNKRIISSIIRNIKYTLFSSRIGSSDTFLFSIRSEDGILQNYFSLLVNNVLNSFRSRGLINNFYFNIESDIKNSVVKRQNYLNNIIKCKLILQLNNTSDFVNIYLDDLVNTILNEDLLDNNINSVTVI